MKMKNNYNQYNQIKNLVINNECEKINKDVTINEEKINENKLCFENFQNTFFSKKNG